MPVPRIPTVGRSLARAVRCFPAVLLSPKMQLALCWRPLRTGGGERRRGSGKVAAAAGPLQQPFPKALSEATTSEPRSRVPWELPPTSRSLRWPVPQAREARRGVGRSPQPQWLGGACNCVQGLRPAAIPFSPPAPSLALGLKSLPPAAQLTLDLRLLLPRD